MNENIKNWLEQDGTYKEGLALFMAHSKNRHIAQYLMRKEDPVKLRYELEKLSGTRLPGAPAPAAFNCAIHKPVMEKPSERLKVLKSGGVRFDDLPEEIQAVYLQACDAYRKTRALHEKMKVVTTDEERAAVRAELLEADDERAACWSVIDRWAEDGTLPGKNPEPAKHPIPGIVPDAKAVGTARVSIVRNLKCLKSATEDKRKDEILARLRPNVAIILAAGCGFGKNAATLAEFGLIEAV